MKVVLRRLFLLGFLVVFCSAFMSMTPVFVNDAYAQALTDADVKNTTADVGGATTGVGSGLDIGGGCSSKDPFGLIACRAARTLGDLKVLVYIISGFGLIAFTFGAIFGKISWKHLSQLAFSLFLVAMMSPFIEYFTGTDFTKLGYGNFLPVDSNEIMVSGSGNYFAKTSCKGMKYCIDEVILPGASDSKDSAKEEASKGEDAGGEGSGGGAGGESAGSGAGGGEGGNGQTASNGGSGSSSGTPQDTNNKWSWNDIKGSVKSGIEAGKAGLDIINTAKQTAKDIGQQRDKIKNAMSGNNGKLGSIINSAGDIVNSGNQISESIYRMDKNVERNKETIGKGVEGVSTGGGNRPRKTK